MISNKFPSKLPLQIRLQAPMFTHQTTCHARLMWVDNLGRWALRLATLTPATYTVYVPRLKARSDALSTPEISFPADNPALTTQRNKVSKNLARESNGQNHKTWMIPKVLAHGPPSPADYRAVSQGSATKSSIACALPSFHQFGRLRILLILINRLCFEVRWIHTNVSDLSSNLVIFGCRNGNTVVLKVGHDQLALLGPSV